MVRVRFFAFVSALFFFLFGVAARAYAADDSIDQTNRQINFVDQTMRDIEQQRAKHIAEEKVAAELRAARQKRRQEARLAAQFAGLSGNLSGLPEMPNFDGKLEFRNGEDQKAR